MKKVVTIAMLLAMVAAGGYAQNQGGAMARAEIINPDGKPIGEAIFTQTPTGVLIEVEVEEGLPPGGHGIHLHAVGLCTIGLESVFADAAGHINPAGVAHGLRHPQGPDNGDLPNLYAGDKGSAMAEFFTTLVSVRKGSRLPALLDDDGSAVIIHEKPDDHLTQPIGGAGDRIACGVIVNM